MYYLQAVYAAVLLLASVAVIVVVTRVVAAAWREREADGQHLAVVMRGRAIQRQNERGEDVGSAGTDWLTSLQVLERTPTTNRQNLDLRLAPLYFAGAILLQWGIGQFMGHSISLRLVAGDALVATAAGICLTHLLRGREVGRGRREGAAYALVALLAVLAALAKAGS